MTPTPSPAAVYRISEKDPVFPARLWRNSASPHWQKFGAAPDAKWLADYSHWSPGIDGPNPDAPEAPVPDKQYEGMKVETVYIAGEPGKNTTITKGFGFISSAPTPLSPAEGTEEEQHAKLKAYWLESIPAGLSESGRDQVATHVAQIELQLQLARRESEGLRAERENWRMSSVCREKEAEIVSLKAELEKAKEIEFRCEAVLSERDKLQEDLKDSIAKHYATHKELQAAQSALGKAEEDKARLELIEKAHVSVSAITEAWGEENVLWWQITKGNKSLSGHPEPSLRAAIDAFSARSAQRTPGEGKGE